MQQDAPIEPAAPVPTAPVPEKVIYSWQAPSRLFKKRNREFYSTVGAIVILLSIILIFAKEFLLVAVILALGFVSYVLASVEPEKITHKLTNYGIRTAGKLYFWQELGRMWWEEKWKQEVLHIETPTQFPGKMVLLLGEGDKAEIKKILEKYLIEEKPEPTWLDKSSSWLQEKIPLETE